MKKLCIVAGLLSIACMLVTAPDCYAARPIRMKMTTQYMDRHVLVQKVYKPWIEEIKKRTNGRVIIQLYNPNTVIPDAEVWNGLIKDQIDLTDHYLARFPGVFPATTVTANLPMTVTTNAAASAAIWELVNTVPEMKDEFKDVKLLAMHSTSPFQVVTCKKEVKSLNDMKGLKFIVAGKDSGLIAKGLGLDYIIQPGPDIYMALSRNMADGVIYSIPVIRSYKVDEATKYLFMSSAMTTTGFVAMNKERWESLPDDIKQIFEETTGEVMVKRLGQVLDEGTRDDLNTMIANGMKVNQMDPKERDLWKQLLEPETKASWMREIEGKISPERANEIYDQAKAVFAKYEAALSAK